MSDELRDETMRPVEGFGKFTIASTPALGYWFDTIVRASAIPKEVFDASVSGSYEIAKVHDEMFRRKVWATHTSIHLGGDNDT